MKIDKKNPLHWLYLALAGAMVLAAMLLRPFRGRGRGLVVLYGHKLGGNLLAIYRELRRQGHEDVAFLTMDPVYYRDLRRQGESTCLAISPACISLLSTADALVSDHGLHVLELMLGRTDLKFFDVWHGIPFKGFDADDFRVQRRYDEVWVASPLHRRLYLERFGFSPERVRVTGYARTDCLVEPLLDLSHVRAELGLSDFHQRRYVLFAPTWKQDASARSLYPFGLDEATFLTHLSAACRKHGAILLVRKHLNSGKNVGVVPDGVVFLPYAEYPDTEAILLLSDVLICDWSSIAFDFLLLGRPTVFLDVEPPFRKGFSLGAEHRFGAVVSDLEALLEEIATALAGPSNWLDARRPAYRSERERIYGEFADGCSAARCVHALREVLSRHPPADR